MKVKTKGSVCPAPDKGTNSRIVICVIDASRAPAFSINGGKPRTTITVAELVRGRTHCTVSVAVYRDRASKKFDEGFIHVSNGEVILEGLRGIYPKDASMRRFGYFKFDRFRINDEIHCDIGVCLTERIKRFQGRSASQDAQSASA